MAVLVGALTGPSRDYEREARQAAAAHAIENVDSWWTGARESYWEAVADIGGAEKLSDLHYRVTGMVLPRTIVGIRKKVLYTCVVDFSAEPPVVRQFEFAEEEAKDEGALGGTLAGIAKDFAEELTR